MIDFRLILNSLWLLVQIASVTLEMEEILFAYLRCEGPSSEEFLSSRVEFPARKYATT